MFKRLTHPTVRFDQPQVGLGDFGDPEHHRSLNFHHPGDFGQAVGHKLDEVIAIFAHDQFIRPFVGDVLVVILIYCSIMSFLRTRVIPTAIFVLLFAYTLEILQYFRIVEVLGLQTSRIARIVIGTTFEWTDLLAYTLGIGLVLILEKRN